jgi:hypothetical protein
MPHSILRLRAGVDTNQTPVLNEAGISSCQLIRYKVDGGAVLVEKTGGWIRAYPNAIVSPVRALWAWEDTNADAHLAVGAQNQANTYQTQLSVITNGAQQDITPRSIEDNITAVVQTVAGNSIVTITDATVGNITNYDSVYIPTHIAIGGLVLFGLYQTDPDGHVGATTYTIQALDALGAPLAAASNSTTPLLAEFSTTSGQSLVTVTLNNHGYAAGSTFPVLAETTVGGVTFYGDFLVQSVTDANNFVITGPTQASATTTGFVNNNKARYIYNFGVGSVPAGTGYGVGGYGRGGYGTGTAITPSTGRPISANDWTLDNWGEILISVPVTPPTVLVTTGTSGTGTVGTITFAPAYTVPVGEVVTISGVAPSGWNGDRIVTASSAGSISFATTLTSAQTQAGLVTLDSTPYAPIYEWSPSSGAPTATVIPQAPPVNDGMFVAMPQRQIIAWGSTFTGIQDPLLIRWCDLNNFNVWIAQVINQAGSYRLPKGSRIVGAIQGPQQGLIWTDISIWSMQYISQPFVWGFNEIGTGCGLIGRKAAGSQAGVVYWMGPSNFYALNDGGPTPIPCDVWDVVFQNLDQNNLNKIRFAANSRFNEVAWYYPSLNGGGEVDSYVKYNILLQRWDYGLLARSAWIDQSVLGPPIGADPNLLYLYQHETSPDADGRALVSNFRTGYYTMNEGDDLTFVDQVWPDMKFGYYGQMQNATVQITFYVANYPGDNPRVYGPFSFTQASQFLTPRFRGRLVSIELGSVDVGSWWRCGGVRYRYAPDGRF